MNIVFITDHPVPVGTAPTNRLLSLALGIKEEGNKVIILIVNPTEKSESVKNENVKGNYKGVEYKYITPSTVLPVGRGKKFLIFFKGLLSLNPVLKNIHTQSKIDAIIILHTWSIYPLWISFFVKHYKIVFLHERNEFPFLLHKKNLIRKIDYIIYRRIVLKLFDGIIVITKNLHDYYSGLISRKAKIIVVPMTVEPDRFGNNTKDNNRYIAYCGYLGGNKDGVDNLIEAFAKISDEFNNYRLYIIGDSNDRNDLMALRKLVKKKGIEEKVVFTGNVIRDEIPELLDKAEVLALARPKSRQADGGFPTKLGEYLSTGNPVVVTKVGAIPDYLTDGINAYLADPDDNDDFAAKLKMAIIKKEQSLMIGKNGKELANTVFNYRIQGQRIVEFIKQVLQELYH